MKKVFYDRTNRNCIGDRVKSALNRTCLNLLSVIIIICLLLSSFSCNLILGTTSTNIQTSTTGSLTAGAITVGKTVNVTNQIIPVSGGTITVNESQSPIAGLEINVPAGSYNNAPNFHISYAPIEKHSLGNDFNPITPLIKVENGGAYSEKIMEVRIPVEIADGYFAMGFFYDSETAKLEGIPTIAQDSNSITLGTRHFSDFIISIIEKATLESDIDSGFRPGIDDWEFNNYGSYIAPDGHCAGQSMTAMWYYVTRPDGAGTSLNNLYDNNGNPPKTPQIWQDNSLGYRFASVVQDEQWNVNQMESWQALSAINDQVTRYLFAYAIKLTGEPQMVVIWSKQGGGHAMIVYRIEKGKFHIADPNYPGYTDRFIEYDFSSEIFKPYHSGDNANDIAAGTDILYETIEYWGKSTIVDYNQIGARWQEFKLKTIGNDKFPAYNILYKTDEGKYEQLLDGHITNDKLLNITIRATKNGSAIDSSFEVTRDGEIVSFDSKNNCELVEGNNNLGFFIMGIVDDGEGNKEPCYIDFIYIKVIYNPAPTTLTINPGSATMEPGESQVFNVTSSNPPENASYEWFVNSVSVQSGSDKTYTFEAAASGVYEISVNEWDDGASPRKLNSSASITITVADTTTTTAASADRLEILRQQLSIMFQVSGTATIEEWWEPDNSDSRTVDVFYEIPEYISGQIRTMPISWSGTGFYGEYRFTGVNNSESVWIVSGNVSADGAVLETMTYTYTLNWPGEQNNIERTVTFSFAGIPIWGFDDVAKNTIFGPQISNYIVDFSDAQIIYYPTGEIKSQYRYVSADWSNGYIFIRFSNE